MRRRPPRFLVGFIVGALAMVAFQGAIARGQGTDGESNSSRPTTERRAPAIEAAVLVAPLGGAQGNGVELQNLLEEERENFGTLLISELRFCRTACNLTNEQCHRIALQAGGMIEQAAVQTAKIKVKTAKRGGIRLASEPAPPDELKLVREILQKLLKECATRDQQKRDEAEDKQRFAHRRETAIHALVARLDRMLVLSSSQRERLLRLFESDWKDEWAILNGVLSDDDAPLPAIPDRLILGCLSANQQKIWKRLDKQALDATEAYIAFVAEIMEGLPSEFMGYFSSAAGQAEKAPAEEGKAVNSNQRAH